MEGCLACGGAILEPNKNYGYTGNICYCTQLKLGGLSLPYNQVSGMPCPCSTRQTGTPQCEICDLRAQLAESEKERLEQARLLGISGERELTLKSRLERTQSELRIAKEAHDTDMEMFLAEHDENVRLHTKLEIATEALEHYSDAELLEPGVKPNRAAQALAKIKAASPDTSQLTNG